MLDSYKRSIGVQALRFALAISLAGLGTLGVQGSFAAGLQTTTTKPKYVAPKPLPRTVAPATRQTPATTPVRPSQPATGNVRQQPAVPAARSGSETSGSRPGVVGNAAGNTTGRETGRATGNARGTTETRPQSSTTKAERGTVERGTAEPASRLPKSGTPAAERTTNPETNRSGTGRTPSTEGKEGKLPSRGTTNEPVEGSRASAMNTPARSVPSIKQKDARGRVTNIKTATGVEARVNPGTGKITSLRKVSPDGTITSVHTSPSGVRNVETVRKDSYGHPIKVVSHGGTGYQERDLLRRPGFKQRTYYENGHSSVRVYQNRSYGRYGSYPVYVPDHYYHPAFYAYAATPFPAPVAFAWGPNPGYAAYGPYFRPSPSYGSPAAFMADFVIGANLNGAAGQQPGMGGPVGMGGPGMGQPGMGQAGMGQAGMGQAGGAPGSPGGFPSPAGGADPNAAANGGGTVDAGSQPEPQSGDAAPIPDDVKNAYVQQIQGQIEAAKSQAGGGSQPGATPGALDPNFKMFQSYSDVEADLNGQQCALTGGDFVQREEDAPDAGGTVAVTVVTIAKPTASHCAEKARVRLPVETLQDWYNSYLEAQQQGFAAIGAAQGKNGFPPATDVATVANPDGQGTPDDPHALAGALQQQQFDATQIQAEVQTGGGQ